MFETVILERENEMHFIRYNELVYLKLIPKHTEQRLSFYNSKTNYGVYMVPLDESYELKTIHNQYNLTKEEYEMVKKWIEKIKCTTKLHLL